MVYALLAYLVAALLDLLTLPTKTAQDKDLEIHVLCHQLRLLQRHARDKPRAMRVEKSLLAVLLVKLKALLQHGSQQLDQCIQTDTVLKLWSVSERDVPFHFLLRERTTKFSQAFDSVFVSERIKILRTPLRAPNANACAERWVRTVGQECLGHSTSTRPISGVIHEYIREAA
jgi:hypothetical protein